MSMNQDLGCDPSQASKIVLLEPSAPADHALARKFKMRVVEMAKQGVFGSLKTRKASLQNSYSQLAALVDNDSVPVLVYGEKGSGKRRLVEEFLTLQNFFRRLQAKEIGLLKVLKADLQVAGFSAQLMPSSSGSGDLIYIENVDALSKECQSELLLQLKVRKKLAESGMALPRLVVGTERALSIMVIRQQFSRDLFQHLTLSTVFLPSLNERQEDLVHLIQSFMEDQNAAQESPTIHVVDALSRYLWPENLDELKKVVKTLLQKNPHASTWSLDNLPSMLFPRTHLKNAQKIAARFKLNDPEDVSKSSDERLRFREELVRAAGNRDVAAARMGISKADFLQKMMTHGLR